MSFGFWGIRKSIHENPWNEMHSLEDYNRASYLRNKHGVRSKKSVFRLVRHDAGDSARNQKAKADFFEQGEPITDIICVSGHSRVIDTGDPDDKRILEIRAKCTTIFFSRLGQCSFTSGKKITQQGFKELEQWLHDKYYSNSDRPDANGDESLNHMSFVESIVGGRTKEYFGMELPLTINLKDSSVHNLRVFGQGAIHGNQRVERTKDPILASSFIRIRTKDIRTSYPEKPLNDIIDEKFERNKDLIFHTDVTGTTYTTTNGATHLTQKGERVTLEDIYTTISALDDINLNRTVLLFFGCRGIKSLDGRADSGPEESVDGDPQFDGGKRKTKSKKSVRRKGKNGSRRKGRSHRKWRHTMHRMRRGAGVRK